MGLTDYNKKRDFKNTPEPKAEKDLADQHRFVVQRHKASHLHYDLRLEMEGVLKSWAVPKGPSMNPKDKRLAIHTEDHPVKYLFFEGVIPKGNYGAGVMTIWDHGTFEAQEKSKVTSSYYKGKMNLTFHGKKLNGDFTLVKSSYGDKENQWLLMKSKDSFATDLPYDAEHFAEQPDIKTPSPKPLKPSKGPIRPMLAKPGKDVFNDSGWIYELKYDGYRAVAQILDGKVELYSRNGISFNQKFKLIYDDLKHIDHDTIIDGEIVLLDKNGVPYFQGLQNYDPDTSEGVLQFMVFDLLHLNGHDTIELPLLDRKHLLKDLIVDFERIKYCEHVEGMGIALFERAVASGLEGIIAKKANSTYTTDYRTDDWLKLKRVDSSEAIICGYTESDKASRPFGSLILGMMDDDELTYVGNCGSGFSAKSLKQLKQKFEPYIRKTSPFKGKINLKGREPVWLKPFLVCEVTFTEWTKDNHMRHPVFKGIREDKTAPEATKDSNNVPVKEAPKPKKTSDNTLAVDGIDVPISNPEKIYWPESGYQKYDLIDYYIKMANYMVPYLIDRPQNLHRHPEGITKTGFYQKDNEHLPKWVDTIRLHSKSGDKDIEYLLCQNEATLLYMANLGCIEINPWHSTIKNLEHPDYTIIDLDPSPKNSFNEVIETALVAADLFADLKIDAFCKTSGASGLHLYIPLQAQYTYDEVVDFTKLLCLYIHERLPKLTTLERSIKKRGNKIYLDYLQNRKGQTIVAPYSVRPKPMATVSTPLEWKELKKDLSPQEFTIKTVPERVQKKGDLFDGVLKYPLDIEKVLKLLENL